MNEMTTKEAKTPTSCFDHMVFMCFTCRQLWLEIWQRPDGGMGGGCPRCELTTMIEIRALWG